ncbi:MAG TPA: hypothetical protein VGU27_11155 [Candidatus Eisenbacteria bacterium]|nr:hypothetical protein [Candidatus Eisenbacteria bacterium]
MCPFCKDKACRIVEQASGRLTCECGRHSWPNSNAYAQSCLLSDLTIVNTVHTWTQSY